VTETAAKKRMTSMKKIIEGRKYSQVRFMKQAAGE